MTDVSETIPTANIRITPKVPSVIAGTGTVNTIPKASIGITTLTPEYRKYPLVDLLDLNGNKVYEITFEDVAPGGSSEPQTLILRNNSSSPITFSLTPTVTEDQVGKDIDTVSSTYFSLDLDLWSNSLEVEISGEDEVTIYIKYNPPSFGKLGEKEWIVVKELDTFTPPTLEGWGFVGLYPVYGSIDGELTNHQVEIMVPYHITMNSDFSDIRFLLGDGTVLNYYEKELVEEDYCLFVVKVPTIPVSPGKEDIFIFCGNPEAVSLSSPEDVFLFFDDMTGSIGDKWQGGGYGCGYGVSSGINSLILASSSSFRSKTFQASAPFKVELGMITEQSNWGNITFEYCVGASKYYAQVLYGANNEAIGKGGSSLVSGNLGGGSSWETFLVILDEDGNHTFQNKATGVEIETNDTTYDTGYIGVSHGGSGWGAVSKIMVSQYTPNQPIVGGLEGWNMIIPLTLKGKVAYSDGDLPGLDPIVKYGCRVGGVYYE